MSERIELPQDTLDLLILCTLSLKSQHGWGISERVQQMPKFLARLRNCSC